MSECIKLDPDTYTPDYRAIERKLAAPCISGSQCDACGKVLSHEEMRIQGYASGRELGLCSRDAQWVNTKAAINTHLNGHQEGENDE